MRMSLPSSYQRARCVSLMMISFLAMVPLSLAMVVAPQQTRYGERIFRLAICSPARVSGETFAKPLRALPEPPQAIVPANTPLSTTGLPGFFARDGGSSPCMVITGRRTRHGADHGRQKADVHRPRPEKTPDVH